MTPREAHLFVVLIEVGASARMIYDEIISFLDGNERMMPGSGVVVDALPAVGHKTPEVLCSWRQARCTNDHDKAPAIDRYERLARNWMALHKRYLQWHGEGAGVEDAPQSAGAGAVRRDPGKIVIAFCLAAIGGKYPGARFLDDVPVRREDLTRKRLNFQQHGHHHRFLQQDGIGEVEQDMDRSVETMSYCNKDSNSWEEKS